MATSGKFWVTEPHQLASDRIGEHGRAALPPITVLDMMKSAVHKHGDRPAMALKRPVNVSLSPCLLKYF